MTLTELVLELQAEEVDRLSDALLEAGALSVMYESVYPGTGVEDLHFDASPESALWPRVILTALCKVHQNPEQVLIRACAVAGIAVPIHELRGIPDEDWLAKSREQFGPIRVSARLWVVPSWHAPPELEAINLVLDPGLAFGTGGHPSTRLCLQWLDRTVAGGETVLDYGCGSGILAIATMKLGASRAVGVDIDPDALAVARANARRNGVAVEFLDARTPLSFTADIVVANILANPLMLLAPALASRCTRGGRIALSGILSGQAREVEKSYAPWIAFAPPAEADGWVCLSGVRL
ncbi:MAG TPA: 50S ribosomal protein L11 methyltransferase [Burkholderiales bacterium]